MRCKQMLFLSVVTVLLAASLAGCSTSSTAPSAVSSEAPSSAASSAAVTASQTPSMPKTAGRASTKRSWNPMVRKKEMSALVTPSPRAVKKEEPYTLKPMMRKLRPYTRNAWLVRVSSSGS